MRDLIKVKLTAWTNEKATELASHGALVCYNGTIPDMGQIIDVEKKLYKPQHHTTLQHNHYTFDVEGIPVGEITFGFHLTHPFYSTGQRSGRYCINMFDNPDYNRLISLCRRYWPELTEIAINEIGKYLRYCLFSYKENLEKAAHISSQVIPSERRVTEKYIKDNSLKIAQEQLRALVPIIFPTGFTHTVNLSTLASIYRSAHSPIQRHVAHLMASEVLKMEPKLKYMFDVHSDDWAPRSLCGQGSGDLVTCECRESPTVKIKSFFDGRNFVDVKQGDNHPLNTLPFKPNYMDNNEFVFITDVEFSVVTFGQDQRHRTINRSEPGFTGDIYVPPVVALLGLHQVAKNIINWWQELAYIVPETLWVNLAPYGAVVNYRKISNANAMLHEFEKRLCWCAMEEICEGARLWRMDLQRINQNHPLLEHLVPPCYYTGKCAEGTRYCGRDINNKDYFSVRRMV